MGGTMRDGNRRRAGSGRGTQARRPIARLAPAVLALAVFALGACRKANADEKNPRTQQEADWESRVEEARKYAERRQKDRTNVPIQSAIGVEVLAGQPNAGAKGAGANGPGPANPPVVTVVPPQNMPAAEFTRLRERARNAVGVTMYTAPWCGICTVARDHLREHRIAFVERDVDRRSDWKRKLLALNPRGSVPTFDVDGMVMVGFGAAQLDQLIGRASDARLARLTQGPKTILVAPPATTP